MNLDVVMHHKVTIKYFEEFIENGAAQNLVHLNIYKIVEIYKKKIDALIQKVDEISKTDPDFDIKNHDSVELALL